MTDEEFIVKLREAFAIEAGEHLHAIRSGLLDLEALPLPDRQHEVIETTFREAHSLKGAARAVNRTDIETVCQELETVFAAWKNKPATLAAEGYDVLNRALDLVGRLLTFPDVAQSPSDKTAITDIVLQIRGLASGGARLAVAAMAAVKPDAAQPEFESHGEASHHAPHKARKTRHAKEEGSAGSQPAHAVEQHSSEAVYSEPEKLHVADTVRVPMAKMDSLLRQAEEMVVVKLTAAQHSADLREIVESFSSWRSQSNRVRDLARTGALDGGDAQGAKLQEFAEWNRNFVMTLEKKLNGLSHAARLEERAVGTLVDELLEDAKKLVMLPFATLLDLFPRQVRDLARDMGKDVDLIVQGREVGLDKRILEEMKAPLIHLVRNAVDHGIEKTEQRQQQGKPARGMLKIAVSQTEGNKVQIIVSDDGGGVDAAKLKASAVKQGVISSEEAAHLEDHAALDLMFHSGISTSPIVTEVSGRGLGMAIVREKVEKLGGSIAITSTPGAGSMFRMMLPVTLATFRGILVRAGGQTFVLPASNAERIARIPIAEIQTVENEETIDLGGRAISFVRLSDVLELPQRETKEEQKYMEIVVLGSGEGHVAFGVDSVLNEQEVLVKNLGKPLLRVRNVAAASVLGSGTPALILNVSDLLKSAVKAAASPRTSSMATAAGTAGRGTRVLVADDSVTSRMLIKNILETSGYDVETAVDGQDAFTALRSREFDLLVSDVEMPRLNGFDLTAKVRGDKKLSELPVVLVTALSSREHRERGIDVGANAYIVKSSFDQSDLLAVIRKLI